MLVIAIAIAVVAIVGFWVAGGVLLRVGGDHCRGLRRACAGRRSQPRRTHPARGRRAALALWALALRAAPPRIQEPARPADLPTASPPSPRPQPVGGVCLSRSRTGTRPIVSPGARIGRNHTDKHSSAAHSSAGNERLPFIQLRSRRSATASASPTPCPRRAARPCGRPGSSWSRPTPAAGAGTDPAAPPPAPTRSARSTAGSCRHERREPARNGRRTAPSRTIREPKESGRAARQRPRPGTGGIDSHADSKYLAGDGLDGFVRWFADWWLRRGRRLTDPDRGDD